MIEPLETSTKNIQTNKKKIISEIKYNRNLIYILFFISFIFFGLIILNLYKKQKK